METTQESISREIPTSGAGGPGSGARAVYPPPAPQQSTLGARPRFRGGFRAGSTLAKSVGAQLTARYAEERASTYLARAAELSPFLPASTRAIYAVFGEEWGVKYTRIFRILRDMEAHGLIVSDEAHTRGVRGAKRVWRAV